MREGFLRALPFSLRRHGFVTRSGARSRKGLSLAAGAARIIESVARYAAPKSAPAMLAANLRRVVLSKH
jgi:hypothetical protein